jgi:hypothetical protein
MLALILAIQLIRPERSNPPVDKSLELQAPKEVMDILKRSCYDCHSYETKWTTASSIAPFMWTIASHVKEGRKALNFSEWKKMDKDTKIKKLDRSIQTLKSGIMPLPSYVNYHDEAKLSKEDKKLLLEWFTNKLTK